jgi:hypothetical protein
MDKLEGLAGGGQKAERKEDALDKGTVPLAVHLQSFARAMS